jgi:hypothetical protein
LKMGASTAGCIWQKAQSIPELPNHYLTLASVVQIRVLCFVLPL